MIDHEVLELQKEARIFAMQRYGYAISDDFEDLLQVLEMEEPLLLHLRHQQLIVRMARMPKSHLMERLLIT